MISVFNNRKTIKDVDFCLISSLFFIYLLIFSRHLDIMSIELTPRSQRLIKRNLIKQMQNDLEHLTDKKQIYESSIADEDSSLLSSQKFQTFRADRDDFQMKWFEHLQSLNVIGLESNNDKRQIINDSENYQDKVLEQRESHYQIYKEYHSDYCCIWFGGTGKWACLLPFKNTGGYIDRNIEKCGYRNEDFED
jgi:hypothetical protein